ncbi:NAD-dependent protein deacetylase [Nucleospora cyclopteri]
MEFINNNFIRSSPKISNFKKCVFIVGAGISVPSGIPDFRSENGVFKKLRKELKITGEQFFSYEYGLRENRQLYLKYIAKLKFISEKASPNAVHKFLSKIPKTRVYTQNIDGLEERGGTLFTSKKDTKGIYLHGNLKNLSCIYCSHKIKFSAEIVQKCILLDKKTNMDFLDCTACLERNKKARKENKRAKPCGFMHPSIVHYGQSNSNENFIIETLKKDGDCDLLVVMGTSLKIPGVKTLIKSFSKFVPTAIYVDLKEPNKEWHKYFSHFYEGDCLKFIKEWSKKINLCTDQEGAEIDFNSSILASDSDLLLTNSSFLRSDSNKQIC